MSLFSSCGCNAIKSLNAKYSYVIRYTTYTQQVMLVWNCHNVHTFLHHRFKHGTAFSSAFNYMKCVDYYLSFIFLVMETHAARGTI